MHLLLEAHPIFPPLSCLLPEAPVQKRGASASQWLGLCSVPLGSRWTFLRPKNHVLALQAFLYSCPIPQTPDCHLQVASVRTEGWDSVLGVPEEAACRKRVPGHRGKLHASFCRLRETMGRDGCQEPERNPGASRGRPGLTGLRPFFLPGYGGRAHERTIYVNAIRCWILPR